MALEAIRTPVNELAKEIGLCLRYYSVTFRGGRPGQVELVGGEAAQPRLPELIAEQLEVDVALGKPLAGIELSSSQIAIERRGSQSEWAVAAGLALRRVGSGRLRGVA